jgi:hypothetical protein
VDQSAKLFSHSYFPLLESVYFHSCHLSIDLCYPWLPSLKYLSLKDSFITTLEINGNVEEVILENVKITNKEIYVRNDLEKLEIRGYSRLYNDVEVRVSGSIGKVIGCSWDLLKFVYL